MITKLFLKKLNSLHENIFFTREVEENNQLPFLDILTTKDKINFLTNVYRKTTFTGQYLPYLSFCSKKPKLNLIKILYLKDQEPTTSVPKNSFILGLSE